MPQWALLRGRSARYGDKVIVLTGGFVERFSVLQICFPELQSLRFGKAFGSSYGFGDTTQQYYCTHCELLIAPLP